MASKYPSLSSVTSQSETKDKNAIEIKWKIVVINEERLQDIYKSNNSVV